jgi:hypothetical protein
VLSVALLVASLLAAVVGHAVLAGGQVRLSQGQARLAAEQAAHRRMELATAQLQTPSRIVAEAEQRLHMQQPGQVTQLPSVALSSPEPTPRMYAAPPPAPATTTTIPATTATTAPAGVPAAASR